MRQALACFALLAALPLAVWLWGHPPNAIHLQAFFQSPSAEFMLGTDELGRDLLTRGAYGLLTSVQVALAVVCLTAMIGIPLGMVSGWYGGWLDVVLMRVTDVFLSFPGILLAIAFVALNGAGMVTVILALSLTGWVGFARLSRVQTLALRQQEYLHGAQLAGGALPRIFGLYILPNIAAPLLVEAVFMSAGAIIAEAGLAFLGIGVQPPQSSLGAMLREGTRYMLVAPHLIVVPGTLLAILLLGVTLLGDGLRDKLDVQLEQK